MTRERRRCPKCQRPTLIRPRDGGAGWYCGLCTFRLVICPPVKSAKAWRAILTKKKKHETGPEWEGDCKYCGSRTLEGECPGHKPVKLKLVR